MRDTKKRRVGRTMHSHMHFFISFPPPYKKDPAEAGHIFHLRLTSRPWLSYNTAESPLLFQM